MSPLGIGVFSPAIGEHGRRRSRNTRRLVVSFPPDKETRLRAKTCGRPETLPSEAGTFGHLFVGMV